MSQHSGTLHVSVYSNALGLTEHNEKQSSVEKLVLMHVEQSGQDTG